VIVRRGPDYGCARAADLAATAAQTNAESEEAALRRRIQRLRGEAQRLSAMGLTIEAERGLSLASCSAAQVVADLVAFDHGGGSSSRAVA
jgi:hypothetical protein